MKFLASFLMFFIVSFSVYAGMEDDLKLVYKRSLIYQTSVSDIAYESMGYYFKLFDLKLPKDIASDLKSEFSSLLYDHSVKIENAKDSFNKGDLNSAIYHLFLAKIITDYLVKFDEYVLHLDSMPKYESGEVEDYFSSI